MGGLWGGGGGKGYVGPPLKLLGGLLRPAPPHLPSSYAYVWDISGFKTRLARLPAKRLKSKRHFKIIIKTNNQEYIFKLFKSSVCFNRIGKLRDESFTIRYYQVVWRVWGAVGRGGCENIRGGRIFFFRGGGGGGGG